MMKYFAVVLALVIGTQAFSPTPRLSVGRRNVAVNLYVPYYNQNHLERAVECSEQYGLCDVDELLKLADEIEKFEECGFEQWSDDDQCFVIDAERCAHEQFDRHGVAEILRLQSELKLRQDYLRNAKLFTDNSTKECIARERDQLLQELINLPSWQRMFRHKTSIHIQ